MSYSELVIEVLGVMQQQKLKTRLSGLCSYFSNHGFLVNHLDYQCVDLQVRLREE